MFQTLFNPVLFRDYQRRQSLASVNLRPPTFPSTLYNPYDYFFGSTPPNLSELKVVLTSVATALNGAIPVSGSLASQFETISGTSILTHGYSIPRLPVYHYYDLKDSVKPDHSKIKFKNMYETEYASLIKWLDIPGIDSKNLDNKTTSEATAVCTVESSHRTRVTQAEHKYNLLIDTDPTGTITDLSPTSFIAFSEQLHVYPRVQVVCVGNNDEEDAWTTTCFGMVVRSFEIDASGCSVPDITVSNGLENMCFADSALEYGSTIPATDVDTIIAHYARARTPVKRNMFKSAIMLLDFSKVWVPRPLKATFDSLVNDSLPGLTFNDNVVWFAKALSFLGLNTATDRYDTEKSAKPVNVNDTHRIHAWSPYSYNPAPPSLEFSGPGHFGTYSAVRPQYFIMNPRSMFGTLCTVVNIQDAIESMPMP